MSTVLALPAVKRRARCETSKPLDAFSRYTRTSDGRQSYCKSCASSYRRAWRKVNYDRERVTRRTHDRRRRELRLG